MEASNNTPAAGGPRGPGYPIITLETAIERTKQLSKVAGRNAAPLAAAAEAWGFSPKSSSNKTTAAALKRYGLIDDVGDGQARMIRITDLGRELLFRELDRTDPKWRELLAEAALRPSIFSELWARYEHELPGDRVIEYHLMFELGYGASAARDLLKKFRETLRFAEIRPGSGVAIPEASWKEPAEGGADSPTAGARPTPSQPHGQPGWSGDAGDTRWVPAQLPPEVAPRTDPLPTYAMRDPRHRSVAIPFSADEWATIEALFPLTPEQWDAMMTMLEAMKPGLTKRAQAPSSAASASASHLSAPHGGGAERMFDPASPREILRESLDRQADRA